jgi:hypothetical protein
MSKRSGVDLGEEEHVCKKHEECEDRMTLSDMQRLAQVLSPRGTKYDWLITFVRLIKENNK